MISEDWDSLLRNELTAPYFTDLLAFLSVEYVSKTIYPPKTKIFNALRLVPPDNVRVVILGQDPYINPGQAHGFAFSVPPGVIPPPSLQNIYKEYQSDLQKPPPADGCLMPWVKKGVLLLNTVLTVEAGRSLSHVGHGWETFTDAVISYLGNRDRPTVFLLWGASAQKKRKLITNDAHAVFASPHPSPLSAHNGFFGSRPFSKANEFLLKHGMEEVF